MKQFPQVRRIIPCLISLVANLVHNLCHAQQLPYFETPTLAANVTHRSSYCFMYEQIYQRNIERRDGLRGKNVSTALFDYQMDPSTGEIDNNAIAVRFLDELGRRAGFEWRNSYGVLEAPSANNNYTYDDLLLWGTYVYDIMGEYYVRNIERLEMGIDYVDSWYDGSMLMVMVKNKEEFQWFTFLKPFSWQVWMLILFSMVSSAIFYYLIDYLDSRRKSTKMEASLADHMFYAPYAFTGHSLYEPRTFSTRLLTFSLCFTFLVLLAIYTANMASLLINNNKASVVINTIDDAIKKDMTICVWKTAATDNFLLLHHKHAKRLPLYTEDECAAALLRGDCQVYLAFGNSWETLKRDVRYNKDCHLDRVGQVVSQNIASFSVQDDKLRCSTVIENVLTIHMVDMKTDGTFDKIWSDYYDAASSHDCNVANDNMIDEELDINTKQIGSLFMLHFTFMIIALIIALFRCRLMPKAKKKKIGRELRDSVTNISRLKKTASIRSKFPEATFLDDFHSCNSISSKDEVQFNNIYEISPNQGGERADDVSHINNMTILKNPENNLNACLSNEEAKVLKEIQEMMINHFISNKQKDD